MGMYLNYILDGALIILALSVIILSGKKGFLSASKNILALILTAVLITTMQITIFNALQSSPISMGVRNIVVKNVSKNYEEKNISEDIDTTDQEKSIEACETLAYPKFMENSIKTTISGMTEIKNNLLEVIADSITLMILKVIGILLVFLVVKIMVFLIIKLLETLFKIPGLNSVNRFLGSILGIINALIIIYIICGAVSLFAPPEKQEFIREVISKTYLVKYFYDTNFLFSLFI